MSIPIPNRPSGFILGDLAADVKIEAFVDIQCPHSKVAWPTLMQLVDFYEQRPVSLAVHLVTLSNHRQAWDISLGLFVVAEGSAQKFADFATFLYQRQDQFYNAAFMHKTHEDLLQFVAEMAEQFCGMDREYIIERMSDHDIYTDARTPIRYAATRAAWATPTFFVNSADDVPLDHDASLDEWVELVDDLLDAQE